MTASNFGARYFSLFLQIFVFAMNGSLYACIVTPLPLVELELVVLTKWVKGSRRRFPVPRRNVQLPWRLSTLSAMLLRFGPLLPTDRKMRHSIGPPLAVA